MTDALGALRSMLSRQATLDEALGAYMGATAREADADADAVTTTDGLLMERLHDLVTILTLRESPPGMAMLAAALIWRSAPLARDVGELRLAVRRICAWREGLDTQAVRRIVDAHAIYEERFDEVMARAGFDSGSEIDAILADLSRDADGDCVVVELGTCLVLVEMTARDYFVGVQDEDGVIIVIEQVPYSKGGGGSSYDNVHPEPPDRGCPALIPA